MFHRTIQFHDFYLPVHSYVDDDYAVVGERGRGKRMPGRMMLECWVECVFEIWVKLSQPLVSFNSQHLQFHPLTYLWRHDVRERISNLMRNIKIILNLNYSIRTLEFIGWGDGVARLRKRRSSSRRPTEVYSWKTWCRFNFYSSSALQPLNQSSALPSSLSLHYLYSQLCSIHKKKFFKIYIFCDCNDS